MRTFAQKGRWSVVLTVTNSMQEATVVVILTRRLTKKERSDLRNLSMAESTPINFRHHIRSYRFNSEDPKKGGYFGKMVIEYGFTTTFDLLTIANNQEALIRHYESSIKRRIADINPTSIKKLQG